MSPPDTPEQIIAIAQATLADTQRRNRRINMVGAAALVATALVAVWAIFDGGRVDPRPASPMLITACDPSQFVDEECLAGPPQPGTLTFSPDLEIPVSGRVQNRSNDDAAYDVRVSWDSIETEQSFAVVDVNVVWEAGRDAPYEAMWAPPQEMIDALEGEVGDLGRWRINGVATPVDDSRLAPYAWTSIATFSLQAP